MADDPDLPGPPPADREAPPIAEEERRTSTWLGVLIAILVLAALVWGVMTYLDPPHEPLERDPPTIE